MRASRVALVLVLSASTTAAHFGAGPRWRDRAPLNVARQEVAAARIGEHAYVVGGLAADGFGIQALRSVEVYDPRANAWSFVADMPAKRDHPAVAAHGGKLYVFGGFRGDFVARDNAWVYDPATDVWSFLEHMPEGRGEAWAVPFGDRIYVFGGADPAGVATATTFVFDVPSGVWSEAAPMPTPRLHLVAARLGDGIHVMGGRDESLVIAAPYAVNERYDPASDTWSTRTPMPTARSAMGLVAYRGRVHVVGGEAPILHAVHEVYDPRRDAWSSLGPMPVPRHAMGAVALDGEILFAGGATSTGLGETAHTDAFVLRGPGRDPGPLGLVTLFLPSLWRGRVGPAALGWN